MSRTARGSKAGGYEYWSARPFNRCGGIISPKGGKHTKRRTHKAERKQGRRECRCVE